MSRYHVTRLHARRWARVRRAVFNRDGWRCRKCGRPGRLECDHVTPMQRESGGDPYDMQNLQTLCRGCHIAKTAAENKRPASQEQREWQALVRRTNLY